MKKLVGILPPNFESDISVQDEFWENDTEQLNSLEYLDFTEQSKYFYPSGAKVQLIDIGATLPTAFYSIKRRFSTVRRFKTSNTEWDHFLEMISVQIVYDEG